MDNILVSIKKMLGIDESYKHFDNELLVFINSVFGILFQLGVGKTKAPFICDETSTWDEFIEDDQIETVKSYMFMKVKLLFDPPSSSFVLSSYEKLISEFEWRCNVDSETP